MFGTAHIEKTVLIKNSFLGNHKTKWRYKNTEKGLGHE